MANQTGRLAGKVAIVIDVSLHLNNKEVII